MKKIYSLFLHCFCICSYAQINLNQGLVTYHPFTGNANDAGPNGINGNIVNATLTADRAGVANSAYYFNGTDAYIELPYTNLYSFPPNGSFSIYNSIIFQNTNSSNNDQVTAGYTVSNSIIENGYTGGTNILNVNPLFVNPNNLVSAPFDCTNYDYKLQNNSIKSKLFFN